MHNILSAYLNREALYLQHDYGTVVTTDGAMVVVTIFIVVVLDDCGAIVDASGIVD
jgi:hypothetical protein